MSPRRRRAMDVACWFAWRTGGCTDLAWWICAADGCPRVICPGHAAMTMAGRYVCREHQLPDTVPVDDPGMKLKKAKRPAKPRHSDATPGTKTGG